MTDSLYHAVGATEFPFLAASVSGSDQTLEPLDPALERLSGLFAAAIRAELGTGSDSAWYAATSALPSGTLANSTDPVGSVWKIEPSAAAIKEIKPSWPLLAVWRSGEAEWQQKTIMKAQLHQPWELMYSLGPLTAGEAHKLAHALPAVGKICGAALDNLARHPAYDSGSKQFDETRGRLSHVWPTQMSCGQAHFEDDEHTKYWSCSFEFESTEMVRETDQGAINGGLNLTLNVGDGQELVPGLVVGTDEFPG